MCVFCHHHSLFCSRIVIHPFNPASTVKWHIPVSPLTVLPHLCALSPPFSGVSSSSSLSMPPECMCCDIGGDNDCCRREAEGAPLLFSIWQRWKEHIEVEELPATTSAFPFPTHSCESAHRREDVALFWPRYDDNARVFSFNLHLLQKCCLLVSSYGETIFFLCCQLWSLSGRSERSGLGWRVRSDVLRLTVVLGVEDDPAGFWAGELDCVHTSFVSYVTPFDWNPEVKSFSRRSGFVWLTPAESRGSELRRFKKQTNYNWELFVCPRCCSGIKLIKNLSR